MHPFLAKARLGPYLAAWVPIAALLVVLVRLAGTPSWLEAAVVVTPLAALFAFICLASWYPCRALPLTAVHLPRIVLTHGLAGLVSTFVWLFLAATWSAMLEQVPTFAGLGERFPRQAAVLAASGLILYALAAVLHCAVRASLQAAAAEETALRHELAAREAELRALRSQVNPHFLFNALTSIAGLVSTEPETVRASCVALADFLRASLRAARRDHITLAEELDLIDAYLAVERLRFGARLTVERHIAAEARDVVLPPLILQPLVENAVVRGIATLVDGGTIMISAERLAAGLLVRVENPFDPTAPARGGEGLGLDNVQARLATLHGNGARLHVHHEHGRFRAEVRLPIVRRHTGAS